jgi:hypothetical protein
MIPVDSGLPNQIGGMCVRTLRLAGVRNHLRLVLFLLAICSLQAQTAQPSTPISAGQNSTIKSDVRIVLLDVVVTQGKGDTVGGLHKEDFKVTEDGRPQTISFFEEHTGGRVSPVALPPAPPDVYTNYPTIKTTDSINGYYMYNRQHPGIAVAINVSL